MWYKTDLILQNHYFYNCWEPIFPGFSQPGEERPEERLIHQMQYVAWPDHGVPDDSSDFLQFVMRVRQNRTGMVEPTVVHCRLVVCPFVPSFTYWPVGHWSSWSLSVCLSVHWFICSSIYRLVHRLVWPCKMLVKISIKVSFQIKRATSYSLIYTF